MISRLPFPGACSARAFAGASTRSHCVRHFTSSSFRRTTTTTTTTTSEPTPEPILPEASATTPPSETTFPRATKFTYPSTYPSAAPSSASITARLDLGPARQPLDPSILSRLPLLKSQRPHFIQVQIHGRSYLVTEGDTVRLPFWMHGVKPGDILRLDAATALGSREFVIKPGSGFGTAVIPPTGSSAVTTPSAQPDPEVAKLADSAAIVLSDGSEPIPVREAIDLAGFVPPIQRTRYLDDRLFVCRATVLGVETEPLRIELKKKQRTRRTKQAKSKHRYTVLRISELTIRGVDEIVESAEGAEA